MTPTQTPVVALGCSYRNPAHYPPKLPCVGNDNAALIRLAY
ncbi:hypothetical protein [Massilia glaciei]|nr:hypothetical protein [Massilia glaciei]